MTDKTDPPIDLLPCPFCGGRAYLVPSSPQVYCQNDMCAANGSSSYGSADEATAGWNTRACPTPDMYDLIDAMQKLGNRTLTSPYWEGLHRGIDECIAIVRQHYGDDARKGAVERAKPDTENSNAPTSSSSPASSEIPVVEPYKAFFKAIWYAYCEQSFQLEDAETIINTAVENGLVKEESYDPQVHGEAMAGEWGLEYGDPCYVLVKRQPPKPVSLKDGADAARSVFDLSLVGPDSGFKPEDVAEAIAKRWRLDYVD